MGSDARSSLNLEDLDPYKYTPLHGSQWLRILRVMQAPSGQDTIYCQFEERGDPRNGTHTSPDNEDAVGYEAISWCWGTGKKNRSITIMEKEKAYAFPVHEHLYEALKALRHTKDARYLWVDAICINQDDLIERNQQVARMNEVYGNATNVCIWLGKSSAETRLALNFIKNDLLHMDSFDELCRDKKYIPSWTAMLGLMKQQWFQRRWVVQEVSLARQARVYCGSDYVTWEEFGAAVSLFVDVDTSAQKLSELVKREEEFGHADDFFQEVPALGATSLVKITNRLFKRSVNGFLQRTSSLEDIVAHLAMFESSEPRDTIYALLSLAKDSQPSVEGIPDHLNGIRLSEKQKKALTIIARLLPNPYRRSYVVNYNQQVIDVYQQFIAFAMARTDPTRALDIICRPFAASYTRADDCKFDAKLLAQFPEPERQTVVELPSWIPNRSGVPFDKQVKSKRGSKRRGEVIYSMERQHGDLFVSTPDSITYCAAGSKAYDKGKVRFRKRRDHYSMFVEGFILDTVTEVESASQLGNIPAGWLQQGAKHGKKDPNVFWKTLVADRSPKGPAPLYYKNAIEAALKHASPHSTFDVKKRIQEATSEIVSGVLRQVQDTIWERCLIVTKRGFLGLAPRTTQKGDVVCILYGCSVPVVMRRTVKSTELKEMEVEDDEKDRLGRQKELVTKLKMYFDKQREKRQVPERASISKKGETPSKLPTDHSAIAEAPAADATWAELPSDAPLRVISRKASGNLERAPPLATAEEALSRGRAVAVISVGLDVAFQRSLRRTTILTVMACIVSYGVHERLVASLLAALAVPHLLTDISSSPKEYRFWKRDVQDYRKGIVVTFIIGLCLSLIMASTNTSGVYAIMILVVFDAVFPEVLPPSLGQRYCRLLNSISNSAVAVLNRVMRVFGLSKSPQTPARIALVVHLDGHQVSNPSHRLDANETTRDHGSAPIPISIPTSAPSLAPGPVLQSTPAKARSRTTNEAKSSAGDGKSKNTDKKGPPLDGPPLDCYYTLVGESYIHGMMNGEAIELQNESTGGGRDVQRILSEIFEVR